MRLHTAMFGLLAGVLAVDLAFDWLLVKNTDDGLLQLQAYYRTPPRSPFLIIVITGINVVALIFRRSARNVVALAGWVVIVSFFKLVMEPVQMACVTANGLLPSPQQWRHELTLVAIGHVVMVLFFAALALSEFKWSFRGREGVRAPAGPKMVKLVAPQSDWKPFPHPFDTLDFDSGSEPYTLVELRMMGALGAIKDKPRWYEKMGNARVVAKWRAELLEQGMHESQVQYIMDELAYEAQSSSAELAASPVGGVYQSDCIVSEELRQRLMQQVAVLENTGETDYHPGSNEQMIDIVHPSLYPYVAGLSREVPVEGAKWENFVGGGHVTSRDLKQEAGKSKYQWDNHESASARFQWLPSEVSVSATGKVSVDSYINNLHPQLHAGLYETLGLVLEKFIPLWSRVLTQLRVGKARRHKQNMSEDFLYYPPRPVFVREDMARRMEILDEWTQNRRPVPSENVKPFQPANPYLWEDLRGRKLQVIFKLATIEIDPAKGHTGYDGGAWHVEGMRNEHIVASGIYYYHTENIGESLLKFRTNVCEPDHEQSDDAGVAAVYGLANNAPLLQEIGFISCVQGRSVAWPNTLQHQVQRFELVDKTKKGVRKILVFFLVDPALRILSTSIVPPQQQSWFETEMRKSKPIPNLPADLQGLIGARDWFFPREKALEVRLELMKERKYFTQANTTEVFERPFEMCEH